jgi:hypothetical protein
MVKKMSVPNATDTGFSESANNLSTLNPSYIISKRQQFPTKDRCLHLIKSTL